MNQTLLANTRVSFNANTATANPFWPDRNAMRAFLAANFPRFPTLTSLGTIPQLIVALAPDFRIPYTMQGTVGFSGTEPSGEVVMIGAHLDNGQSAATAPGRSAACGCRETSPSHRSSTSGSSHCAVSA